MKKFVVEIALDDDDVCMEFEQDVLNEIQYLAYELLCTRIYKPAFVTIDGISFSVDRLKKVWEG